MCLDIDDTLSTSGKLTSEAYGSLWDLHAAGLMVVPVTGRPAGWCDHIARFWPINAVVGENGAFTFYMDRGIRKRIDTPTGIVQKIDSSKRLSLKSLSEPNPRNGPNQKLDRLQRAISRRFPHAQWASDQSYREFDLAVDICEDVAPWSKKDVQALLTLCQKAGAQAKLSSVHVNIWFGQYDKRKGFEHWLAQGAPGCNPVQARGSIFSKDQWLYIGDSPNDESMFESFKYSVGVANLKKYLDRLTHFPTWLTQGESGEGFSEMARKLVLSR